MFVYYTIALASQPHWIKGEYEDKSICFREFSSQVSPDASIHNFNPDTRGLLFSVY